MHFFKALTYPLGDRRWLQKVGLAILFAAIPFVGYFLIKGWEFEISVRVRHNDPEPMPDWRRPFHRLGRGVLVRLVGITYNLPTYVLVGVSLALWINVFLTFFRAGPQTWQRLGEMLAHQWQVRVSILLLAGVYALAANILYWSGYLRYIETRDFASFFDIIENMRLALANPWDDLAMALYQFIMGVVLFLFDMAATAGLAATGVGAVLAPIVVPAFTFTISSIFSGHLFGQLATRTLGSRERPPAYPQRRTRKR